MRFIGDIHGDFARYLQLIDVPESIQVGDFGIGFGEVPEIRSTHKFIPGNHDDPALCKEHPNCLSHGARGDLFVLGGGLSVDRDRRTEGVDWWSGEQLSFQELEFLIDLYAQVRPRVMVSHDGPRQLVGNEWYAVPSRTRDALSGCLSFHRPQLWVFGHWHRSISTVIDGTWFVCLNKYEVLDVDLDSLENCARLEPR